MQRLEVYTENPFYFYDRDRGHPIFLSGQVVWTSISTPRLWYSHSPLAFQERQTNKDDPILDPDKVIAYLASKGGNCCRLTTLYGSAPPGETPGPVCYPWAHATASTEGHNGRTRYDLLAFNQTYWQRFRHYLRLLEKYGIRVILEVFPNLWGYQTLPLHPDNNVNYTTEDLPGTQYWYRTVRGGSEKVLRVQEAFVRKVVLESLPFRNVLYLINNQYGSPAELSGMESEEIEKFFGDPDQALAWPRYWAKLIKEIGRAHGETLLVSTMPRFHSAHFPLAEQYQWFVDEELFDFIDAGWWQLHPFHEEYEIRETKWMQEFDDIPLRDRVRLFAESLRSWYDYQVTRKKAKPLVLSKALFWDGVQRHSPWPMWVAFTSGFALASPHEPMSRSYWHAPRYEPTANVVGHLHRFVNESEIEFWKMKPTSEIAFGLDQDAYVLANPGEEYVVYLVGEAKGPLLIRLLEGEYIIEYYDPKVGQWIDTRMVAGGDSEVFVHKYYSELALLIQRKEKREAIMGVEFPQEAP